MTLAACLGLPIEACACAGTAVLQGLLTSPAALVGVTKHPPEVELPKKSVTESLGLRQNTDSHQVWFVYAAAEPCSAPGVKHARESVTATLNAWLGGSKTQSAESSSVEGH